MVTEENKENHEKSVDDEHQDDLVKEESIKPFTLEILKLIKDAQQQHGLRHGDYQRYRGYCSRRVRRLRKVLKIPQGDRRHFKRRDVNETHINNPKSDERFLHIPLILAERNWAYAMQLRQEANTEPRKKFHLIQKLRKACIYALQIEELCKSERCDARTKLEAQAYVAWIHGSLHFELQLWDKATENLKKAQVIYEKLLSTLSEEEQLPYKQRVDEIAPSLRYCAYNIGDDKAVDLLELRSQGVLENFNALITQTKEEKSSILHEVQWYGTKVPIHIERVRLFLLSIEGLDDTLNHAEDNQARIKLLENMFIDLRDIITLTRDEVRGGSKEGQLLLAYLIWVRGQRTIQRNLLLIQQTRKPQDCVRLFDIIIQQVNEFIQMETLKDDPVAQNKFEQEINAYKALRAFYTAKSHAFLRRWKEAIILFDTSIKYFKNVNRKDFQKELCELLENFEENTEIEKVSAQANYVLEQEEEQSAPVPQKAYKSKKPLIERLDEFREDPQLLSKNPNLVTLPPAMEPVPAKPLFYDLALNFVEMPNLEDKMEGGQRQKQGAGISGFVKGLWGWGNK